MVNAAGDIASRGSWHGEPLRAGVADPRDRSRLLCVVDLAGALATSGDYERPGQLLDPRDGTSRCLYLSASVTGPDLAIADALATALCVGGEPVLEVIAARPDYAALVVEPDGAVRATSGFPFAR